MEPKTESIRERLLSRLPQPANLAVYREEVASLLEKNEKAFRREKWFVSALWIFAVALSTPFLVVGLYHVDRPKGLGLEILAGYLLLYPGLEIVKHFINRSRVDILKEVKQVQVQVLELHALLCKGGAPTSNNP